MPGRASHFIRRAQYGGLRGAAAPGAGSGAGAAGASRQCAPRAARRRRGLWPCVPGTALHPAGGSGHRLRGRLAARGGEGRGHVLLHGGARPLWAGVCMDQLLVDATDTGAAVGDVATLIGADGRERITAEEAAEAAGTIANELFVPHRSPRAPRLSALRKRKPRGVVHTTPRGCFLLHNKKGIPDGPHGLKNSLYGHFGSGLTSARRHRRRSRRRKNRRRSHRSCRRHRWSRRSARRRFAAAASWNGLRRGASYG